MSLAYHPKDDVREQDKRNDREGHRKANKKEIGKGLERVGGDIRGKDKSPQWDMSQRFGNKKKKGVMEVKG